MDRSEIATFIAENRAIAQQQLARWDGVDPSRLLQACDLLEQLLNSGAGAGVDPRTIVVEAAYISNLQLSPVLPFHTHQTEIAAHLHIVPGSIDEAQRLVYALRPLTALAYYGPIPLRIEITPK